MILENPLNVPAHRFLDLHFSYIIKHYSTKPTPLALSGPSALKRLARGSYREKLQVHPIKMGAG
jgi:hypothetical protein